MTKPRTVELLIQVLDEDLSWRKWELSLLKTLVRQNRRSPALAPYIRSAIPLLYAHWEGFVKFAATQYVRYITYQDYRYNQLKANFIALAIKSELHIASQTSKALTHTKLVEFMVSGLGQKYRLQYDEAIQAKSNLNSDVLFEIVTAIGLDYSAYETKRKLIDEKLLKARNNIAHGEYLEYTDESYFELHDEVIAMLDMFNTQLQDAVVLKQHLAPSPTP